jgi:transcriptional regulator with AAA-type ATPase domain
MQAIQQDFESIIKKQRTWAKDLAGSIGLRGVREGDELVIDVFQERKKHFKLNRVKYTLYTSEAFGIDYVKSEITLPVFGGTNISFEIELVKEEGARLHNEKSRYLLRSLTDAPFKLNGIFCFEAFLERGDIVDIGFNRLMFSRSKEQIKPKCIIPENIMKSSIPIVIEGETGTGKTTIAGIIHEESARPGRFVHLNLSAFSPALIESELFGHVKGAFTGALNSKKGAILEAHKGTLFLDEIDSLTIDLQTKLLLFLDNYQVRAVGGENSIKADVRLIFASGSNLKKLVEEEKMRRDFYYRLQSGCAVYLPALREEAIKIKNLCLQFEEKNAVVIGRELIEFYIKCPWPGNIRQLNAHLMKKKILSDGKRFFIDAEDKALLSSESLKAKSSKDKILTMEQMKINYCYEVYLSLDSNLTRAAQTLEVSTNTLKAYLMRKEELGNHEIVNIDLLN